MKEFFNSLLQTSNERMRNPFISSFIIALIVINWRAILVIIFSGEDIEDRIMIVEEDYLNWYQYFLFPILIAFFYTLVLPYFMVEINKLLKKANMDAINSYYEQEIQRTIRKRGLVEEEVKLELVRSSSHDINQANEKIQNLKENIEEKDRINTELQKQANTLQLELDRTKNEVLKYYNDKNEDRTGAMLRGFYDDINKTETLKELIETSKQGINTIRYDYYDLNKSVLNEMMEDKVIQIGEKTVQGYNFRITPLGKEFWKKIEQVYPQRIN